jgi:hypothetical protein
MTTGSVPSASCPRWSLAGLSLLHGAVFGAAAAVLPWPAFTAFGVLAGVLGAAHVVTSALAFVGAATRRAAFRTTSLLSLVFLGYFAYAAIGSGLYVHTLYDGVGLALLAAALAAFCVGLLFLLPYALWGLATTGGLRLGRGQAKARRALGGGTSLAIALVVFSYGASLEASRGRGAPRVPLDERDDVRALVEVSMGRARVTKKGSVGSPSMFLPSPIRCAEPPERAAVTVALTFLARQETPEGEKPVPPTPEMLCLQEGSLSRALDRAAEELSARQGEGEAYLDVIASSRVLAEVGPLLGAVHVRPGVEGVCDGSSCLLPWQLFGLDAFTEATNVAALQAELGTTPQALRKHLRSEGAGYEGLVAFQTQSFSVAWDRTVTPMRHLRKPSPPTAAEPTTAAMTAAIKSAAAFVVSSQVKDGRFRYTVQPFTGVVSFDNFSVPRQAGTTLALCDAAAYHPKAKDAAKQSLAFLETLVRGDDARGGIVWPKNATRAALGSTALPTIAFLRCREHVGGQFDATITKLIGALLAMQRPDGSFMPIYDTTAGAAVDGKDALYAAGQAVFALVLLEGAAGEGLPRPEGLREAIDRAMAFHAGPYWDIPLADFFYLEENWHCLAARAALTHHRNDAYERFCIDYMTMKSRMIERPEGGIDADQVGAYAFGHVFPPHHAAAAGFAEGLAAAVALKRVRGLPIEDDQATLSLVMKYLLHQQWTEDNCGVCTRKVRIPGGFSENVASPVVRIDFVQHAMAGMLHGAEELGLLETR